MRDDYDLKPDISEALRCLWNDGDPIRNRYLKIKLNHYGPHEAHYEIKFVVDEIGGGDE